MTGTDVERSMASMDVERSVDDDASMDVGSDDVDADPAVWTLQLAHRGAHVPVPVRADVNVCRRTPRDRGPTLLRSPDDQACLLQRPRCCL